MTPRGDVAPGAPRADRLEALARFVETLSIPERGDARQPPRDDVRALEAWLGRALADPEFLVECLGADLAAREAHTATTTGLPPFLAVPRLGVQVALAYWAPGREAGAHEHSSWTVTAVAHNELEVTTYDWESAQRERRLVPKRVFGAQRGRVGHIYDPCVHNPRNPSNAWSISLHVFGSARPSLLDEGATVPGLEAPGAAPDATPAPLVLWRKARERRQRHHAAIRALSDVDGPTALGLLRRLHAMGDTETRSEAALAIRRLDPALGDALLAQAAADLAGPSTPVERASTEPAVHVELRGGRAELVASCAPSVVFLRVDARAARALTFAAAADRFSAGDLRDELEADDRLTLVRALVSTGLFRTVGSQVPREGELH